MRKDIFTSGNGGENRGTAEEYSGGLTGVSMKDTGRMTCQKVMGDSFTTKETSTKETSMKGKLMGLGLITIGMGVFIQESGKKTFSMGRGWRSGRIARSMMDSITTA